MDFATFNQVIKIKGHEVEVLIRVTVEEDETAPDFDFGDEEENKVYKNRFDKGDLFNGLIQVKASALGEHGYDCLGGVHLTKNNYFHAEPFIAGVNETLKEHDMVQNALFDLVSTITAKANELKKFI